MSNVTLVDKINNNGVYADRAVKDKNGFDITETYAPRKSLARVAVTGDFNDLTGQPSINPHLEYTNSIEPTDGYDWARINVRLKKQHGTGANLSGLLVNGTEYVEALGDNITEPNGSTDVFYFADGLTSPLTYTNKTLYFYVDSPLRVDTPVRFMVVNESSLANVTSSSKFLLCSDSTWSVDVTRDGGLGEWVENWNNYYSSGFDWTQPFLLVFLNSESPSQAYDSPDYYISQYGTSVFYNNGGAAIQDHEQIVAMPGLSVDTSVIATKSDLSGKQNTLTAGTNVTITDNTISATDTTYTAGTNVSISAGNVISATDTTYTAGNMMALSNGAFGVSTTAGITDIQLVQQMPAAPVATVLYIIPEN